MDLIGMHGLRVKIERTKNMITAVVPLEDSLQKDFYYSLMGILNDMCNKIEDVKTYTGDYAGKGGSSGG